VTRGACMRRMDAQSLFGVRVVWRRAAAWSGVRKAPGEGPVHPRVRLAGKVSMAGCSLARYTRKVELYDRLGDRGEPLGDLAHPDLPRRGCRRPVRSPTYWIAMPPSAMRREEDDATRGASGVFTSRALTRRGAGSERSRVARARSGGSTSLRRHRAGGRSGSKPDPSSALEERNELEYPYVSNWTRADSAQFPLLPGEEHQHLALLIAGPPGQMRFDY